MTRWTPNEALGTLEAALLGQLLDAMTDHVQVFDADGNITWANRPATAQAGVPLRGLVGQPCPMQCRFPAPCPEHCVVERVLRSGHAVTAALDAQGRSWEVRGYPVRDEHGRVQGAVELRLDVTERRQVSASLGESEQSFGWLVEESPNMIFVNRRGRVVYVNSMCTQVMGYSREEFLAEGFDFLRTVAPESLEVVRNAFREHMDGRQVAAYEYTVLTKTGERLRVMNSTRLINFQGDTAILAVVTDIGAMHRAKQALRESEERYRTLVETCPDAIVLIDTQGAPVLANQRAAALFGYETVDAFLAATACAFDYAAPEDQARARTGVSRVADSGPTRAAEYSIVTSDGTRVPVEVNATAMRDLEDNIIGAVSVIRDVRDRRQAEAERRRLEAEVRHAQKLESLGVLAGGIAHDFNNLLTGMLGFASLALMDLPVGSRARPAIEKIEESVKRAAGLADQMLTYAGKGELSLNRLDLSELVKNTSSLLAACTPKRGSFAFELAPGLSPVLGDVSQLTQVAMNLMTNAAEALGDRAGVVAVRTGEAECDASYLGNTLLGAQLEPGRFVYLEVEDTGTGMDRSTLEKIFDPFFTTKFSGRGLGLAAVLGIVRGHQGAIRVRSDPGRGTSFRVLLPAADGARVADVEDSRVGRPEPGTGTVLVVDDDSGVRQVAAAMLEALGFSVLSASSGAQAVTLFEQQCDRISVVLLDMTMPGMNGIDTLARLRAVRPDVRAILSTGYDEHTTMSELADQRPVGFLKKPYTVSALSAAVQGVLSAEQ